MMVVYMGVKPEKVLDVVVQPLNPHGTLKLGSLAWKMQRWPSKCCIDEILHLHIGHDLEMFAI